jgi:hypothetical protein
MPCIILNARHGLALKFVVVLRRGRADYYCELPTQIWIHYSLQVVIISLPQGKLSFILV